MRTRSPIFDSAPDGAVAGFLAVDVLPADGFVFGLAGPPSELLVPALPALPCPSSAHAIPVPEVRAVPMPRATANAPTRPMYLVDSMKLRTSPLNSNPTQTKRTVRR
ncbi:hypothetical protein ATO49_17915 [Mycolicibacterium fortuitum subsp. fortuitum DSM 46621 = ATCC 6841 = JCM 6387]|nr:hypothetical protein ATO49_17915 [Mycolicibacterium fortuitum subsp. fortuitum DSM 46621 = ATCC 6841 = JCM 6387]